MAAKKLVYVLVLAIAIQIALGAAISVYVSDASGSDSSGDGTMGSPFKTIEKAKAHVRTLPKTNADGK